MLYIRVREKKTDSAVKSFKLVFHYVLTTRHKQGTYVYNCIFFFLYFYNYTLVITY